MTRWTCRLAKRPQWRRDADGMVTLRDPVRGTDVRLHAWTAPVLEALERGEPAEGIERAAGELAQPRSVRRFLDSLAQVGLVAIDVPRPDVIGGWEVTGELGRGGVGIAYAVERGGRIAVAKVPWDFHYAADVAARVIREEAAVLARLDHEAVVPFFETVSHDDALALVRGRANGRPLDRRFEGDPAKPEEARRIVRVMGEVLLHLQGRGLVLVDYKPANWLVSDEGSVTLIDAGHARAPGSTRVGGTPGFMPPEVAAGGAVDARSDVWGLGRLYGYLRRGQLPRVGQRAEGPLDGVPEDARDVVAKWCASDPWARPASVEAALASF